MTREDWDDGANRAFGFQIGRVRFDEAALLVLINGAAAPCEFILPAPPGTAWRTCLSSDAIPPLPGDGRIAAGAESLTVLESASAAGAADA
jgi:pullulanase/glycogen debranching enzyme